MATSITAHGPRGGIRRFTSVRKAARALSGNGTDTTERTRSLIRRRLQNGGGYVGRTYVETTN